MNYLFIIKSNNKTKGGSVFAPLIIRDVITDIYKLKIDTLFFKEVNFRSLLFNLKISDPKVIKVNQQSNAVEIESIIQLLIWLFKNINDYNLVIVHGIWSYIYIFSSLFCIFFKKPFCFHPHGSLDPFDICKKKRIFKYFIGYFIYRNIFNYCSGIIFTSNLESQKSKIFGSSVNKYIANLTSPTKIDNLKLNGNQISEIKKKYLLKKEKKILLFLSRIDSKKGLDILLKSLSILNQEKKIAVLLIAGVGNKKYMKYISNLIKELDLTDDIRLLGHISGEEKSDIIKISDLFVLPTLNENFGIAIVEALQNNLPVLITKDVYIHEDIINENAGYLCNREPLQLSDKIKSLLFLLNDVKNEKQYSNCFNRKFSREICAKQHVNIYSRLSKKV